MRRSEIDQDIILWKWRSRQLLGRLTAFTPSPESSSLFAYDFFIGHLMSPFFPTHALVHITLSFLTGFACCFWSNYFLSLRVHRSIMGEITYRAVFGKLETGGTRLAMSLKDLRGDRGAFRFNRRGTVVCGGPA